MPASPDSCYRAANGAYRRFPIAVYQWAPIEMKKPGGMEAGMARKEFIYGTVGNGSLLSVNFSVCNHGACGKTSASDQAAQLCPLKTEISITGVINPTLAISTQHGAQILTRNTKKRAQQPAMLQLPDSGHARQPIKPTAALKPHEVCLRLVICCMSQKHMKNVTPLAPTIDQRVSRVPGQALAAC
tara:strand:- start:46 stop:603 length:558 start_codon:yes stop_codon:yes gene_type:complete